jgi:hypothetical protein
MQISRTDGLIYTMLALATAAAILSSPERPSLLLQQAASAMFTASVSEEAVAAGALGDVRYLNVPP